MSTVGLNGFSRYFKTFGQFDLSSFHFDKKPIWRNKCKQALDSEKNHPTQKLNPSVNGGTGPRGKGIASMFVFALERFMVLLWLGSRQVCQGQATSKCHVMGRPEHGTLPTKLNESQTTQPGEEEAAAALPKHSNFSCETLKHMTHIEMELNGKNWMLMSPLAVLLANCRLSYEEKQLILTKLTHLLLGEWLHRGLPNAGLNVQLHETQDYMVSWWACRCHVIPPLSAGKSC